MGGLKRAIFAVIMVCASATPGIAGADLFRVFAECVGRFSAEREHAWLMGDPDADHYDAQRLVFLSLLEATVPKDRARDALSYRIEVKLAHASLLTRATFALHPDQAETAQSLAKFHMRACQHLLLDS